MFRNKVVLITGASSGIGAATATLFASQSADLSLVGRNETNLKEVAKECEEKGVKVLTIIADLSIDDDVERIVRDTIKTFGKIDIVVNNAGFGCIAPMEDITTFDRIIATNLRSVYKLTGLVAPHLEKTKGNIVNISSTFARKCFPQNAAYCVSKAALDMFTRCAALELGPKGIRVNSVNPGLTKTRFLNVAGLSDEEARNVEDHVRQNALLKKIVESDEVADQIVHLASEKARSVTGAFIVIDNGELVQVP